jgi:hypothetical protein
MQWRHEGEVRWSKKEGGIGLWAGVNTSRDEVSYSAVGESLGVVKSTGLRAGVAMRR